MLSDLMPRPASVKYALLILFLLIVLLTGSWIFISRGLRNMFDDFAVPLHKSVAWLTFLRDYKQTKTIDAAHVAAILFSICTFVSWEKFLRLHFFPSQLSIREATFLRVVAGGFIVCDVILFAMGIHSNGGFGADDGRNAFATLVCTCLYALGFMFGSYLIVKNKPED